MDRTKLIKDNADIGLTDTLFDAMERARIDIPLSIERIRRANRGDFDGNAPIKADALPGADDPRVIDPDTYTLTLTLDEARARLAAIPLPVRIDPEQYGRTEPGTGMISFSPEALERIGLLLAPAVAFGSLNGGSASSYLDRTRIRKSFSPLLDVYHDILGPCDRECAGKPKGCTPAYWNPDGSPGYDFLELKMRALLIKALKWRETTGIRERIPLYPMFEMTSHLTHDYLRKTYPVYADGPLLGDAVRETGWDTGNIRSALQPLLAAMTYDRPFRIFDRAGGLADSPLAMPGGHGHSFYVLRDIYREMYDRGIRFAYMGNIDNSGLLVNDRAVAILALTGKQGSFDFSLKTEADVKGGILIEDAEGRLNCGDIGLAISRDEVERYDRQHTPILFNTAGGLFNLEWVISNLDTIIRDLPTRLVRQEKDRGRYTISEQVTWEILGMMDNKIIHRVDKYRRFIAAKMVVEMLMASRLGEERLQRPDFPESLRKVARNLQQGLSALLEGPYGMRLADGRWAPVPIEELKAGFSIP